MTHYNGCNYNLCLTIFIFLCCSEIGKIAESCLLDGKIFSEALESHGHDVSNLAKPLSTPGSKTKTSNKVFVYKSSLNIGQYHFYAQIRFELLS